MGKRVRSNDPTVATYSMSMTGRDRSQDGSGNEPWTSLNATSAYNGPEIHEYCEDTVTPNFRKRVASGEIINNDFLKTRTEEINPTPKSYSRHYKFSTPSQGVYGREWNGTWAMTPANLGTYLDPLLSNPDMSTTINGLIDRAVTSAHANASSAELSMLMVAAEGRKTIDSMASIMKRVLKICKAAKKLDLKYLKKQISQKELQDRYMELRYAIRPLIIDTQGVVAALEQSRSYKSTRATARGFESYQYATSDTTPLSSVWGASGTVNRTVNVDVNIRAGVLTDVQTSGTSIWGMDQFAETMWEITPFSFIIDWVWNIGDKIAAFMPSAGVVELASWVTIRKTVTQKNVLGSINSTLTGYDVANTFSWGGEKSLTTTIVERRRNPKLTVYPEFKLRLDSLKLLDLAIIGRNVFR